MKAALGQPVIVENVAGAAGSIGVGKVVRATPDGYTLSIGDRGNYVLNQALYPFSMICEKICSP
jgi:tripartite-type tricarboxylate transporter receptor subunit TctC